ncbi:MAG: PD-(D/E)XK nuclease family protein [Candidatus Aminicenantes bacterium]|nr:PD-(D/E)XK nuclease family protein [Candidatus Aminicenantes bacterium]
MTAKCDRLELRGDDLFVLDYKTSGRTTYLGIAFDKLDLEDRLSWAEHVASLQLPFYHLVLAGVPTAALAGTIEGESQDLAEADGEPFAPARNASNNIQCVFVMLGRNRLGPGIEFPAFGGGKTMKDLDKILSSPDAPIAEKERALGERTRLEASRASLTEHLIGRLLDEIVDPDRPFDPTLRRSDACERCPYAALCGR